MTHPEPEEIPASPTPVCPLCDQAITVEGHVVRDARVVQCPRIGSILTPPGVI
jgi:hypothetical protein